MKIILLQDEKKLGKKGDIIEASEGYARNYILPKKIGVEASSKNLNDLKLHKANEEKVAQENLDAAKALERPHFDIVASGARMRAIRQERKISVKQVMEYMGFESTQAVYKWEAGKCFPQADNLIALAILYRVSPMELLVEEDLVPSSSHIWGNAA